MLLSSSLSFSNLPILGSTVLNKPDAPVNSTKHTSNFNLKNDCFVKQRTGTKLDGLRIAKSIAKDPREKALKEGLKALEEIWSVLAYCEKRFAEQKPGSPEQAAWREAVEGGRKQLEDFSCLHYFYKSIAIPTINETR